MPSLRLLPPQFLLPAWSPLQLRLPLIWCPFPKPWSCTNENLRCTSKRNLSTNKKGRQPVTSFTNNVDCTRINTAGRSFSERHDRDSNGKDLRHWRRASNTNDARATPTPAPVAQRARHEIRSRKETDSYRRINIGSPDGRNAIPATALNAQDTVTPSVGQSRIDADSTGAESGLYTEPSSLAEDAFEIDATETTLNAGESGPPLPSAGGNETIRMDDKRVKSSTAKSDVAAISLLEELFPEEVKRKKREQEEVKKRTERYIPRLVLSVDLADIDNPRAALERPTRDHALGRHAHRMRKQKQAQDFRRREVTVLVLRNASKSLAEEDFRRIAPKGKHIEDWKKEGDILKIIPGRDPSTLAPLNHYFILFPTPSSAHAYHTNLRRLHRLSRTYTPRSDSPRLALAPGYLVDNEDMHALMQDYALIPSSQSLSLRTLNTPLTPAMRRLVEAGGYLPIVERREKGLAPVLMWVEGWQPNNHAIREAIGRDGRERGLLWALADSADQEAVSRLDVPVAVVSDDETEGGADTSGVSDGAWGDGEADEEQERRRLVRKGQARWIVSFRDEAEARRFVRHWHRGLFPLPRDIKLYGEPWPVVNAEILW